MTLLIIGLAIFFFIHMIPMAPAAKTALIGKLSLKGYKGLFSLIALLGLVLIVIGKANAPFENIYSPPSWGRHVTMLSVWIAFILLPAAHMPGNIKRFTRHPMLWGVVLWGVGHLLANGDLASIILFGSFVVYSLLAMFSANLRGAQKQQEKLPIKKDLVVFAAGTTVYVVIMFLHPYLFGYALMG